MCTIEISRYMLNMRMHPICNKGKYPSKYLRFNIMNIVIGNTRYKSKEALPIMLVQLVKIKLVQVEFHFLRSLKLNKKSLAWNWTMDRFHYRLSFDLKLFSILWK